MNASVLAPEPLSFQLLTAAQCGDLNRAAAELTSRQGMVYGRNALAGGCVDESRYRAREAFISPRPCFAWLWPVLEGALHRATEHFGLSVPLRLVEMPRHLTYERGGHFGWHVDAAGGTLGPCRRVTVSVQLSAQEAYQAGRLLVRRPDGSDVAGSNQLGHVTIFPAQTLHQGEPVTSGIRQALVAWGY